MDIGSKISELRKSAKMTQGQLAKKMNVSLQAISKWENGIAEPSASHIFMLYKIFGEKLFEEEKTQKNYASPCSRMSSIKDIYKIGRGPSSSHSIGPERACKQINTLHPDADEIKVFLFGSLAKTGKGHGTDYIIKQTLKCKKISVFFDEMTETVHPNTMKFEIYKNEQIAVTHTVESIGGGDIVFDGKKLQNEPSVYRNSSFTDIANFCKDNNMALWEYVVQNEPDIYGYLEIVWNKMVASIKNGLNDEGILPGGLNVYKKSKQLFESEHIDETPETKENRLICAYAFAISEQNASSQTIVTAPTCGAAGVLPAVLYYEQQKHNYSNEKIYRALATAGLIGNIIKTNASISGAECGCQAEIGSACAMAAAALGELFELSIDKIEYAAEIALEHHLGLTCDPVCGLVQIPCIERNAVAAMRAINAVNLASFLWQTRKISFDNIVKTMRDTGRDLLSSYRETSEGGLAKIIISNANRF